MYLVKYGEFILKDRYTLIEQSSLQVLNTLYTNDNKPPSRINFSKHLDGKLHSNLEWPTVLQGCQ